MRYEKPTLKLGIAPTRRDLWNNKETNDNYQKILERTKEIAKESGIELVTLEEFKKIYIFFMFIFIVKITSYSHNNTRINLSINFSMNKTDIIRYKFLICIIQI